MKEQASGITEKLSLQGIAVLTICAVTPFMRITVGGKGLLSILMVAVVAFYLLGVVLTKKTAVIHLVKFQMWVIILSFLLMVSVLFAPWSPSVSFEDMKVQICTLFVFSYISNRKETRLLVVLSWLASLILIYLYFFSSEYYLGGIRKYILLQNGVYLDPNMVTASFILPCIWSVKIIVVNKNIALRILFILYLLTSVFCSFMGGSRAGLIAIALGIGILLLQELKLSKKNIAMTLTITVTLIVAVSVIYSRLPIELRERISVSGIQSTGGAGRSDLWETYLLDFFNKSNLARFLFGYGKEACVHLLGKSSHNILIDYLWDLGVAGVILFLVTAFQLFKYCVIRKDNFGIAVLVAVFFWSLTISANDQLLYWILIYSAVCISKNAGGITNANSIRTSKHVYWGN